MVMVLFIPSMVFCVPLMFTSSINCLFNCRGRERERDGYAVDMITVGVGSRGFVNFDSFRNLQYAVGATRKELHQLLLPVSSTAIKGSFTIWTNRNHVNNP